MSAFGLWKPTQLRPNVTAENWGFVPGFHWTPFATAERYGDPLAQVYAIGNADDERTAASEAVDHAVEHPLRRTVPVLHGFEARDAVELGRREIEALIHHVALNHRNAAGAVQVKGSVAADTIDGVSEIVNQSGFYS